VILEYRTITVLITINILLYYYYHHYYYYYYYYYYYDHYTDNLS